MVNKNLVADLPEQKQRDFYQKLRRRLDEWITSEEGKRSKWAGYLLCIPDLFHLLCKLSVDGEVSLVTKAKLLGTIAYVIMPMDLIPELMTGPLGFTDDIALAALVINGVLTEHPDVVKKHWAGDGDILELIQNILHDAEAMVGSGIWGRLQK